MTRFNVQEHLINLQQARDEAFSEADWDRVSFIDLCIDDTQAQLNSFNHWFAPNNS